jgi:two-component system phosphate regulon sensor histidine kinase PhoR
MLLTDPIAWLCAASLGYAFWQRAARKREQGETRDGVATLRRLLEQEPAAGRSLPAVARVLARETAALRPRITLLELMLAESSAGLMVVSRDQAVLAVNTSALRILAAATLNAGDAATQRLSRLAPHPALIECVEQTFVTNTARETEFEIRKASGRNAVAVATRLLRRDDAPYACMLTIVDVTQLRQLERMRQDFVANVSHELRTPITAIVGWVETMAGMELGPAEREVLETVDAQAGRLESLVNDLLMLARLENVGLQEAFVELDIEHLFGDVIDSVREQADGQGIALAVEVDAAARYVMSEARALTYVIRNLVENGIKYTGHGGRVMLRADVAETGELRIAVSDTGVGIAKQHLGRIFERFYRVDPGRSRDMGGTGLGLAIVKHFATALGGRVEVASEPGQGSVFTLLVPPASWNPPNEEEPTSAPPER